MLAWAGTQHQETALQLALFEAYFGEAKNPADPLVLREKAIEVGLDGDTAEAIARSDQYTEEVREAEQRFMDMGVSAVPAFILDGRYLISGAQRCAASGGRGKRQRLMCEKRCLKYVVSRSGGRRRSAPLADSRAYRRSGVARWSFHSQQCNE